MPPKPVTQAGQKVSNRISVDFIEFAGASRPTSLGSDNMSDLPQGWLFSRLLIDGKLVTAHRAAPSAPCPNNVPVARPYGHSLSFTDLSPNDQHHRAAGNAVPIEKPIGRSSGACTCWTTLVSHPYSSFITKFLGQLDKTIRSMRKY